MNKQIAMEMAFALNKAFREYGVSEDLISWRDVQEADHPTIAEKEVEGEDLILITTDRGNTLVVWWYNGLWDTILFKAVFNGLDVRIEKPKDVESGEDGEKFRKNFGKLWRNKQKVTGREGLTEI
jgi:hypothetical protein